MSALAGLAASLSHTDPIQYPAPWRVEHFHHHHNCGEDTGVSIRAANRELVRVWHDSDADVPKSDRPLFELCEIV